MIKFREHRGPLEESMKTVRVIADRNELVALLRNVFSSSEFFDGDVQIHPYRFDPRIGWNTHIVTIKGVGVAGFTDGNF